MELQQLYSYTRRAISDYDMVQDGDKIAIGISGGKDSLCLLYALAGLRRFYPKRYELVAITVDLTNGEMDFSKVKDLCDELDVEYHVIKTDIRNIVFEQRGETNPCSLCSKMRKGSLNDKAKELGCNKTAFAHHKDDIIETMLLSLIYEGRFHSFRPVTYLDRMDLTLIRPLMYVPEMDVIGFQNKYELPVSKPQCDIDGHTNTPLLHGFIPVRRCYETENQQINLVNIYIMISPDTVYFLFFVITPDTLA